MKVSAVSLMNLNKRNNLWVKKDKFFKEPFSHQGLCVLYTLNVKILLQRIYLSILDDNASSKPPLSSGTEEACHYFRYPSNMKRWDWFTNHRWEDEGQKRQGSLTGGRFSYEMRKVLSLVSIDSTKARICHFDLYLMFSDVLLWSLEFSIFTAGDLVFWNKRDGLWNWEHHTPWIIIHSDSNDDHNS